MIGTGMGRRLLVPSPNSPDPHPHNERSLRMAKEFAPHSIEATPERPLTRTGVDPKPVSELTGPAPHDHTVPSFFRAILLTAPAATAVIPDTPVTCVGLGCGKKLGVSYPS